MSIANSFFLNQHYTRQKKDPGFVMGDNVLDLSNVKMNLDFLRFFSSDEDSDGVNGAVQDWVVV